MIYINETSGTINIPRHTYDTIGNYSLIVTSNLSNDVTIVENGENISTNSLYYKFTLDNLNLLNVGEYTYNLYDDNSSVVIETGLLMYGNFKREVIVNNTFNKDKVQYNG